MTEKNSTEKQVVESVAAVLKPDIKDVGEEHIQALLNSRPAVAGEGEVEVFNIRGGSEKAGTSSGIVIFSARIKGVTDDYVLRFAPYHSELRIFSEYDIAGQFHIHRLLNKAGLRVPNVLCYEASCENLPQPGFIMQRIDGDVSDANAYASGLFYNATDEQRSMMLDDIMTALGEVHSVDWQSLGLDTHCMKASGRTPIERHLNWYWKTVEWAQLACIDRLRPVRQWLIDNQPSYHKDDWTMVHGDTNIANYMFKDYKLVSIIDWEMSAISHPSFDIASLCTYNAYCRLASPSDAQKLIPSNEALKTRYEAVAGHRLIDFDYYSRLAAFPGLVTIASMGRAMPQEHQAANARLADPLWAIAEGEV